jgi:XTP/dITP diphosphohydrolase
VKDLAELAVNWHAAKASEKQRDSVFDGIPAELPALLYAAKVHSRTPAAFQVPAADSPLVVDGEVLADSNRLGDALFRLVGEARLAGIDAESALREAANRARRAAEPGRD